MVLFLLRGTTTLFLLRVVSQLVQWIAPQDFLPPFSQFHGGVLPYPALLATQLLILGLMVFLNLRVRAGWRPSLHARRWLLGFSVVYFSVMLFRFAAGIGGWIEHEWFHRPVPAFFHMVLATYLAVLACASRDVERKVQ